MDTLMNKLKENKKLFVIILIISLIAILLGSYAIYKNSYKTEKTANSEKVVDKITSKNTDLSKVTKVEGRLIDKTTGKTVKGVKLVGKPSKSGNGEITVKSENTSKSTPTVSKPSTSSSSGATSTSKPSPKPKEKTKVWIVDKPAWTENRVTPIYETKTYWVVTKWDNSETVTVYSAEEAQTKAAEFPGSYQKINENTVTGYNTETITHPEEGHWEYR